MSVDVTRVGDGMYRVVVDGRSEIVWTAGADDEQWAFWNGRVWAVRPRGRRQGGTSAHARGDSPQQSLTAPMPATVLKVLVAPGAHVRRADTLVILEAMKMELPIRAGADAVVRAVSCREGELVQAGAPLVELD
jgi:3-methylcrotonyl-CoA carboxylase alpha subunit